MQDTMNKEVSAFSVSLLIGIFRGVEAQALRARIVSIFRFIVSSSLIPASTTDSCTASDNHKVPYSLPFCINISHCTTGLYVSFHSLYVTVWLKFKTTSIVGPGGDHVGITDDALFLLMPLFSPCSLELDYEKRFGLRTTRTIISTSDYTH
jgi:hypothetical protein